MPGVSKKARDHVYQYSRFSALLMVLTRSFLDRGVACGPVNVLFQSGGKSLKLGQIKLGDMQVLISLSFIIYLTAVYLKTYEAVIYPDMHVHNPELTDE